MAHKCAKCGREFGDGSVEILKGCPSCGGKKFLYIKEKDIHADVLDGKSIGQIARETKEQFLEVHSEKSFTPSPRPATKKKADEPSSPVPSHENLSDSKEFYEKIESIRILNPGSYELNIEKLAKSDELVVRMGKEDKYMVDILSMSKDKRKNTEKKK